MTPANKTNQGGILDNLPTPVLLMVAKGIQKAINQRNNPPADEDVRTITQSEAARRLGVSRTVIARLIRNGAFHTVKLGKDTTRINLKSFLSYAKGQPSDWQE